MTQRSERKDKNNVVYSQILQLKESRVEVSIYRVENRMQEGMYHVALTSGYKLTHPALIWRR